MSLGAAAVFRAVCDHARTLGGFAAVLDAEPKSALDASGLSIAFWAGPIDPVQASGLSATSVRMELTARLYRNMLAKPYSDAILLDGVDRLIGGLSGDFDLGGRLRSIDLLGAYGAPLGFVTGYVELDSKLYRIADVTIPLIVNDLWTQTP